MLGLLRSALRPALRAPAPTIPTSTTFARGRHQLAPKQVKWDRKHKGRIPIPTGGSTRGTTLAFGEWGIRIIGCGARLTAKQLGTAEEVIKRKLKILKGSKVWMRVFPDIPVCVKVRGAGSGRGKRVLTSSDRVTRPVWVRVRGRSSTGRLGACYAYCTSVHPTHIPTVSPSAASSSR